ncbi:hypothetical protein [Actinoplanes sp. G11-F43]|uniref:hypothetical protein n=1 Tax=Actinoplanes sp. G11-F43 TaxID=3424130 RepID=UPI003D33BF96
MDPLTFAVAGHRAGQKIAAMQAWVDANPKKVKKARKMAAELGWSAVRAWLGADIAEFIRTH